MIQLFETGAYLINGTELIADNAEASAAVQAKTGKAVDKAEAAKQTIAYNILQKHNTSGNMEKLKIKFDKLTSHDITFVGIIQTARASGLTKFPVPYVLTNCHNSLCAVGGTINESVAMVFQNLTNHILSQSVQTLPGRGFAQGAADAGVFHRDRTLPAARVSPVQPQAAKLRAGHLKDAHLRVQKDTEEFPVRRGADGGAVGDGVLV